MTKHSKNFVTLYEDEAKFKLLTSQMINQLTNKDSEEFKEEQTMILYRNPKAPTSSYWKFIRMIAPSESKTPLGGWKNRDCIGIYCLECKLKMPYTINDSKCNLALLVICYTP